MQNKIYALILRNMALQDNLMRMQRISNENTEKYKKEYDSIYQQRDNLEKAKFNYAHKCQELTRSYYNLEAELLNKIDENKKLQIYITELEQKTQQINIMNIENEKHTTELNEKNEHIKALEDQVKRLTEQIGKGFEKQELRKMEIEKPKNPNGVDDIQQLLDNQEKQIDDCRKQAQMRLSELAQKDRLIVQKSQWIKKLDQEIAQLKQSKIENQDTIKTLAEKCDKLQQQAKKKDSQIQIKNEQNKKLEQAESSLKIFFAEYQKKIAKYHGDLIGLAMLIINVAATDCNDSMTNNNHRNIIIEYTRNAIAILNSMVI